jgi:uncharacterized protein YggT (Ycf19 family)
LFEYVLDFDDVLADYALFLFALYCAAFPFFVYVLNNDAISKGFSVEVSVSIGISVQYFKPEFKNRDTLNNRMIDVSPIFAIFIIARPETVNQRTNNPNNIEEVKFLHKLDFLPILVALLFLLDLIVLFLHVWVVMC